MMSSQNSLKTLIVIGLAIVTACIIGMHSPARPCSGPYQPTIPSGAYLRVTADGHGVLSGAAQSSYVCVNGHLIESTS